jgi:toxic protein SymE
MKAQTRLGKMHYKNVQSQRLAWTNYVQVPWLNLSGQWLEKAGFPVGEPIVISVSKNKLVITKIKTEKNEGANSERKKCRKENANSKSREDEAVGV